MKKFGVNNTIALAVLLLAVGSLSACGNNSNINNPSNSATYTDADYSLSGEGADNNNNGSSSEGSLVTADVADDGTITLGASGTSDGELDNSADGSSLDGSKDANNNKESASISSITEQGTKDATTSSGSSNSGVSGSADSGSTNSGSTATGSAGSGTTSNKNSNSTNGSTGSNNNNSNNNSTNNNNSSSTGSNSANNNSSSNGNSAQASTSSHTNHTWVAQYKTVHHDAVTHTEKVIVGSNMVSAGWECGHCGLHGSVDDPYDWDRMEAHQMAAHSWTYYDDFMGDWITTYDSQKINYWDEIPIYGEETVVDKEAYDEQVLTGYKCSVCGATK